MGIKRRLTKVLGLAHGASWDDVVAATEALVLERGGLLGTVENSEMDAAAVVGYVTIERDETGKWYARRFVNGAPFENQVSRYVWPEDADYAAQEWAKSIGVEYRKHSVFG